MSDFSTNGLSGGLGLIMGTLLSYLGFKAKIADLDKRMDRLSEHVVYDDTCLARKEGFKTQLQGVIDTQREMRDDIKAILKKM